MEHPRFERYILRAFARLWRFWPERMRARKAAAVIGASIEIQRCASCQKTFPRKQTDVDHIVPKVRLAGPKRLKDGWLDLNDLRARWFVPADHLQVLCKTCHKEKTKTEGIKRRKAKKNA